MPGTVAQASRRGRKKDDDDEDYIPKSEQRQLRFSFKRGTEFRVLKQTGHKKKNFNRKKYKAVYTCLGNACGRPLGYVDRKGGFVLTNYTYRSKGGNLHTLRAVALDHHKPWKMRLARLKKKGASREEMREDYQDETRLRSLCKRCNESHAHEGEDLEDYDSDEDGEFSPDTPTDEVGVSFNWGGFWPPPPPPPSGGGVTV